LETFSTATSYGLYYLANTLKTTTVIINHGTTYMTASSEVKCLLLDLEEFCPQVLDNSLQLLLLKNHQL
jgi:hypothetical protein